MSVHVMAVTRPDPMFPGVGKSFLIDYARQTKQLNAGIGPMCPFCHQQVRGTICLIDRGDIFRRVSGFCCERLAKWARDDAY